MNSYTFGMSGSVWWYVLLVLIGIAFTVYTYRYTVPPVSKSKKTLLMVLRSIGLSLLLFVLFEPVISIISGKEEDPKLAVLIVCFNE